MTRLCPCLLTVSVLGGCTKPTTPPAEVTVPDAYPIRTGWLVASDLKSIPVSWNTGGRHPLACLSDPADRAGNAALIQAERSAGAILNLDAYPHLKEVGGDPRPRLATVLATFFGTPAEPRVGPAPEFFSAKIAEKEALAREKQGTLAKTRDEDKKEKLEGEVGRLREEITELKNLEQPMTQVRDQATALGLDPATLAHGAVVYRTNCLVCHGPTGGGNGPAGQSLTPMPRDYRQGLFKFTTVDGDQTKFKDGIRPRRADLARTVRNGLDGSAMPAFAYLPAEDIDALVSYIIHLSLRGEAEYRVLRLAADKKRADEFDPDTLPTDVSKHLAKALSVWVRSDADPLVPEANPYHTEEEKLQAAVRGHKLFLESCLNCHIGYGRDAKFSFDSWGSVTRARNLPVGGYRVGRDPADIYARVYNGIPGVGMPSHQHLKANARDRENGINRLWDVVYFAYFLGDANKRRVLRDRFGLPLG